MLPLAPHVLLPTSLASLLPLPPENEPFKKRFISEPVELELLPLAQTAKLNGRTILEFIELGLGAFTRGSGNGSAYDPVFNI